MKKRIIFMGTPEFSVQILNRLSTLNCDIVGVVSQPDRKVGRKQVLTQTPIKKRALELNYPVFQPEKIGDIFETLANLKPDLMVTCAYGQFIPERILNLPTFGSVNVHASLLPKYRGGAPIHKAIIQGETESGITLMRMVKKMDAGDILFQEKCPIYSTDTVQELHDRLAQLGADLLAKHWNALLSSELTSHPQDESLVTYAYNITSEQEFVRFNRESLSVYNHIRGLNPWPLAYGLLADKKVKLIQVSYEICPVKSPAGTILGLIQHKLAIQTLDGILYVESLQVEGKTRMSAQEAWLGLEKQWMGQVFKDRL